MEGVGGILLGLYRRFHGTMASMADSCLFCLVASGALEAARVWEDTSCVAFLDHRPLFPGHCLVVPRIHIATLAELPDSQVAPLFSAARLLSRAVEEALGAEGSFVAINNRVSQSVPHLHVHVVPRRKKDGLRGFFWPRTKYASAEEMERTRALLASAASRIQAPAV
jgi:histidine triad (HIT) family protein